MKSWVKSILEWYKERDCKYYVIKIEDMAKACKDYPEFLQFQGFLDKYNKYRDSQCKPINKYFIVNRDEYPQYASFREFKDYLDRNRLRN